jgi:hypothetical protein
VHTAIPLRACISFASFILAGRFLAIPTSLHNLILAHPFSHSVISLDSLLWGILEKNELYWLKIYRINKYLSAEWKLGIDPSHKIAGC